MSYSINEATALIYKAVIGAKLHSGVAQDLANATVCLCCTYQHAFDGADIALQAIENHAQNSETNSTSLALTGINIFEQLIVSQQATETTLDINQPHEAALSLGYATLACQHYPQHITAIRLTFSHLQHTPIDISSAGISPQSKAIAEHFNTATNTPQTCRIQLLSTLPDIAESTTQPTTQQPRRITIDNAVWEQLIQWAVKSYVESSEHSQQFGAGAGITDND